MNKEFVNGKIENREKVREKREKVREVEWKPGICCFCEDECNPASQCCGVCMRKRPVPPCYWEKEEEKNELADDTAS